MFLSDQSILIVIDIQGKLAYLMHDKEHLFKHVSALIKTADLLNIPVIFTEQLPDKIGATIPEISGHFKERKPIIKSSFSCCGEQAFLDSIKKTGRTQIIICGIETHVCVFQTVSDLIDKKFQIQVVADAVSSRTEANKRIALKRMSKIGATLTSTEMLATELLRTSQHPKFKDILGLIR